jgi:tetratricopeptide (TPR) repeat protein
MEAPAIEDAPQPPAPEAGPAREGRTPPPGEPDIPLRPRAAAPTPPASAIDLNQVLDQMGNAAPGPTQNLDEVFNDFRSEISKQTGAHEAAEQLGLAKTYLEMGMSDEAMTALRTAARSPGHRFEASSMLGRLYLKKKDLPHAIEWLERAAEAPAPSANDARQLLYELGALLEATGETSRALAVFLELQADAGEYRDVAARVERLSKVQTGG